MISSNQLQLITFPSFTLGNNPFSYLHSANVWAHGYQLPPLTMICLENEEIQCDPNTFMLVLLFAA